MAGINGIVNTPKKRTRIGTKSIHRCGIKVS